MPFINDFLEHNKIYESATSFWRWSAYCTIAAILRDNCYRQMGDERLYTNIYVLLLADSAVGRKGKPIKLCGKILRKINNTKIISGKSSVQGIFDEMVNTETDAKTGKLIKGGASIFLAEELASALVLDPQAIAHLTDMYEFKEDFKERLRGHGKHKIDNMVFSMFAGSNETMLKNLYTNEAVQGGLLGRTFLIVPNEEREPNSLLDTEDTSESFGRLVQQAAKISELAGPFIIEDSAKLEYDNWYKPFYKSYQKKKGDGGIAGRLHIGVLKIAFILAANDLSLKVCKCHMEEAIFQCCSLLPNYNAYVMASGKSDLASAGSLLLTELLESHNKTVSRKQFLRKHWLNCSVEILDKVVIDLELGGHIKMVVDGGNEMAYQMTDYCLNFMKGKEAVKQ